MTTDIKEIIAKMPLERQQKIHDRAKVLIEEEYKRRKNRTRMLIMAGSIVLIITIMVYCLMQDLNLRAAMYLHSDTTLRISQL